MFSHRLASQAIPRRQRVLACLAEFDLFSPRWGYIGRSTLAAVLALGTAYGLQLETPYSAATTVLLVANPNQGAVLAKGGWRLLGTMVGGAAALGMLGSFVQAPNLFILGFALWLGLCTSGATLFRHFRAYGAAVAGYTIGLATYGALEAPERALDAVLGRVATVAVGVVCLGAVTALFSQRATRRKLEAGLVKQVAAAATLVLDGLEGRHPPGATLRPEQIGGLFALDDLLEASSAESPEIAIHAGAVRDCIAALFGAMLGALDLREASRSPHPTLVEARGLVGVALPQIVGSVEAARFREAVQRADSLRATLRGQVARVEASPGDTITPLIALDRLVETIEDYGSALRGLAALHGGRVMPAQSLRFHRDWAGAVENGLRSLLAILLAGAFGIATGWSDWSLLLLLLAPFSVLLAMTSNPAAAAVAFLKGTLVAVPMAFVCAFGLLPSVQGFPLLVAAIAPFWIAGLYATTIPQTAPAGLAYLLAFNTLVGATNPMVFSLPAFLNQTLGWIVATVVTLLVFRLLLPHDPHRQASRIAAALRQDVLATLRRQTVGRRVWEHLQHHRLVRIALSLKADPAAAAPMLADGIAGLHLGRSAMRVRAAAGHPVVSPPLRSAAMDALAIASRSPRQAGAALTGAAATVTAMPCDGASERVMAHRIAASLADMAALTTAQADWLAGHRDAVSC